jgi:hypothetical protein
MGSGSCTSSLTLKLVSFHSKDAQSIAASHSLSKGLSRYAEMLWSIDGIGSSSDGEILRTSKMDKKGLF